MEGGIRMSITAKAWISAQSRQIVPGASARGSGREKEGAGIRHRAPEPPPNTTDPRDSSGARARSRKRSSSSPSLPSMISVQAKIKKGSPSIGSWVCWNICATSSRGRGQPRTDAKPEAITRPCATAITAKLVGHERKDEGEAHVGISSAPVVAWLRVRAARRGWRWRVPSASGASGGDAPVAVAPGRPRAGLRSIATISATVSACQHRAR